MNQENNQSTKKPERFYRAFIVRVNERKTICKRTINDARTLFKMENVNVSRSVPESACVYIVLAVTKKKHSNIEQCFTGINVLKIYALFLLWTNFTNILC